LAEHVAVCLAPLIAPKVERLGFEQIAELPSPAELVKEFEESGAEAFTPSAEVSSAAAQAAVSRAPRVFLDEVRDRTLRMLVLGPQPPLDDEWNAVGIVVGQLAAAPLLERWLRDHGRG
jgi:hypothetical protein